MQFILPAFRFQRTRKENSPEIFLKIFYNTLSRYSYLFSLYSKEADLSRGPSSFSHEKKNFSPLDKNGREEYN